MMIDTLKAIGIPVTAAAVISALVVAVPLLFKIDERYAKEEDLRSEVAGLKAANADLQRELAQLSGFQQAMTQFISEGRLPRPAVVGGGAVVGSAPALMSSRPPAVSVPPSGTFDPIEIEPAAGIPSLPASAPIERPANWRELGDALKRQQERLAPR